MIAASLGIKQTIGRDLAEPGHYNDLFARVEWQKPDCKEGLLDSESFLIDLSIS